MTTDRPQPDPEDLAGEIDRLRRRIADLERQLQVVADIGIDIDAEARRIRWRSVDMRPHW